MAVKGTIVGVSNWLLFGITIIGVVVFLLNEVDRCGESQDFCSLLIFLGIFTVSWVALIALSLMTGQISVKGVKISVVQLFFTQDPKSRDFIWVGGGFAMIWLMSYLSGFYSQPLIGIFGAGIIMMIAFYATNTAMIPIMIHGAWNGYVVLSNAGTFGSLLVTSPIYVPNIGVDIFNQAVLSELFTHLFLVAPAEELFTIFMYAFFLVIIKLKFTQDDLLAMIVAGVTSRTIWALYHLQIALN